MSETLLLLKRENKESLDKLEETQEKLEVKEEELNILMSREENFKIEIQRLGKILKEQEIRANTTLNAMPEKTECLQCADFSTEIEKLRVEIINQSTYKKQAYDEKLQELSKYLK